MSNITQDKRVKEIITRALDEDLRKGDITTDLLITKDQLSQADIVVKEDAIICGLSIAKEVFHRVDDSIIFHYHAKDGDEVKHGTSIAEVKGSSKSILKAERVALNFLGHLSGITTHTHRYVQCVQPFKAKILDTRKTTPGMRILDKYAVRCGGGTNHRNNLAEMVMIKDNHRHVFHPEISIADSIKLVRKKTKKILAIEADTLTQFEEALAASPDIILLDNMPPAKMKIAVKKVKALKRKKRPLLEASGGVTFKNIHNIAETGVDRISIGAVTHSNHQTNFSLEFKN